VRTRLIWLSLVVLFLAARYQNLPGVLTNQGVELNDTDPYYRLHRIERIVNGSWVYPLRDSALSYPNGFDVPWPTGLDEVIAIPLKLLGIQKRLTIELASALVIPLLHLPLLYFVCKIAGAIAGFEAAVAAGLLVSLAPTDTYAGGVGRLDHHFLEGMLTVAALFLSMRKRWRGLAILLGLAPAFWPQAWVLSLFLSFSFFIRPDPEGRSIAPPLFFRASWVSLATLALSDRLWSGSVNIFGFSWWTTLLYALIGCFFQGQQWFASSRGKLAWRSFDGIGYTAAIALFLFFKNGSHLASDTASTAYQAISASSGILKTTSESISTFRLPIKNWPQLGLIPLALAWIWFAGQSFRRDRWWLVGYMAGPLILCAIQARFIPLASPIFLLASVFLAKDFAGRLLKFPEYQNVIFAMGIVALLIPSVPRIQWSETGNAHPLFASVRAASSFLASRNEALSLPFEKRAIASHWDDGHWLLYYGKMPVVAHPFQDAASNETLNIFVSETDPDFAEYLSRHPIRYLLVETPTMRITNWLTLAGKKTSDFLNTERTAGGEIDTPTARFYKLLAYRFFMQNGLDTKGQSFGEWRLMYVSPYTFFGKKGPPSIKIFERVPGIRIVAKSKEPKLVLAAKLHTTDGEFYFHQQSTPEKDGTVSWRIPYGKTEAGGVTYDGTFWVDLPNGTRKPFDIVLSEEDAFHGRFVDLGTIRW
jgi:asparagine N-glycosylation enzyme membrane subunit Stt3